MTAERLNVWRQDGPARERRASTGQKDYWCAGDKKQAFPLKSIVRQEVRSTESSESGHTGYSDGKKLCSRLLGRDNLDRVNAIEGMLGVWRTLPLLSRQS